MTPWREAKAAARRRQRLWQLRDLRGAPKPPACAQEPVTVLGLFGTTAGLGEAARLLADGLEALGRDVARIDVTRALDPARGTAFASDPDPGRGPVIVHLNPVEAAEVMAAMPLGDVRKRRRIGVWLHETTAVPPLWPRYAPLFHEIWSPGEASAAALREHGIAARCVPYMHRARPARDWGQRDRFHVLVMADYHSSLARKNIGGALEAFGRAFGPGDAVLQLKIANLPARHALRAQLAGSPDVQLIERDMDAAATQALIGRADALLSLHRGEGYGLTLVEAVMLGTPVVMSDEPTTAWLHTPGATYAVGGRAVAVRDPQGLYAGGEWFDADLDRAAHALRECRAAWASGAARAARPTRRDAALARFTDPGRLDALSDALA